MLVRELLIEEFSGDEQIANAVSDIVLGLRQRNIDEVGLNDIAGEVSKMIDIYVDPNGVEFKDTIRQNLLNTEWVDDVTGSGVVVLKKQTGFDHNGKLGQNAEKAKDQQKKKVQKLASKNLKDRNREGKL